MEIKPVLNRKLFLQKLDEHNEWDIIIIGGGATGLGTAVDSASRGYSTLLLEQSDFSKGTSSRSTKLVHGGVRYLAQGRIKLVFQALRERGFLFRNASHLVKRQSFIIPCYNHFSLLKYLFGLKLYDALSGKFSFGNSIFLSRRKIIGHFPHIKSNNLKGGIQYFDGQFDDSRLAINLAQTAAGEGGIILNYLKVTDLIKAGGKLEGLIAMDVLSGKEYRIKGNVIVNATGVFVDDVMKMDNPFRKSIVRPSQGVHLVVDKKYLPGSEALMVPGTPDGRVLFAIPWCDHILIGTTDTPVENTSLEPVALETEIDFILETFGRFFSPAPGRSDVKSVFAGLRPLAAPKGKNNRTREISRDHKIIVNNSGLISITGGKWTTYRMMGEAVVNTALREGYLKSSVSKTKSLMIHGQGSNFSGPSFSNYGSDGNNISNMIVKNSYLGNILIAPFEYTIAEVLWGVRHEMACKIEDILARRLRLLFIDANAAKQAAPLVASIMAAELGMDEAWEKTEVDEFVKLARQYNLTEEIPDTAIYY